MARLDVFVFRTGLIRPIRFALKYAAVIICAIARFRPRMGATAWLLTAIVLVSAILPGVAAVPRFRVPVEPILNLAAAAGLLALLGWRRKTI